MSYSTAVRTAKFVIYPSFGQYGWRLIAGNGEKVASGEAYATRESAKRAVDTIKRLAPTATVGDEY